ncbi:MAG: tetratricopeptide repeat protein [Fibrobacterota bacterium]
MKILPLCVVASVFVIFDFACADSFFESGNSYYEQGEYDRAVTQYSKAYEKLGPRVNIFYNMGHAYYRLGRPGESVLWYERALLLDPGDTRIRNSLTYVRSTLQDTQPPVEKTVYERFFVALHGRLPAVYQYRIMLIISPFFLMFFSCALFKRGTKHTLFVYLSGVLLVCILFLSFSIWYIENNLEHNQRGVVMVPRLEATNGPREKSTAFILHEGMVFRILEQRDSSYAITFSGDETGWVEADSIGIIENLYGEKK